MAEFFSDEQRDIHVKALHNELESYRHDPRRAHQALQVIAELERLGAEVAAEVKMAIGVAVKAHEVRTGVADTSAVQERAEPVPTWPEPAEAAPAEAEPEPEVPAESAPAEGAAGPEATAEADTDPANSVE